MYKWLDKFFKYRMQGSRDQLNKIEFDNLFFSFLMQVNENDVSISLFIKLLIEQDPN